MPKIGATPDPRPFNRRCTRCGCLVEKMVSRFGLNGKPAAHAYHCKTPMHYCGTVERDGCEPVRVFEPEAHAYRDSTGIVWEHPGRREQCETPECIEMQGHRAGLSPTGVLHPGKYEDCYEPACEPPF